MLKFCSKPVSEHAEVPLADEGRWESLIEHWNERSRPTLPASREEGKADYVVSVGATRDGLHRQAQLAEMVSLVANQGDRVVGQEVLYLATPNPRTLLGKGIAQAIAMRARAAGADMLVLDAELSPSQTRNLEDAAGIAICDREAIILNVFLRHARTRQARSQVELARLEYLRPRIRGVGLDMDQQAGGMARARGPGETYSELLARKIDGRIEELKKTLRRVETTGHTQRRQRSTCQRLVLVGYTNAGKTSLMNALTGADLSARDRPFETLDTTSRCLTRHGGNVLLSDTVGFIRRLPPRLLASFRSTLAEVAEASLLVLALDASDPECALHLQTTLEVIQSIGAYDVPRFYVFTKADRVPPAAVSRLGTECSEGHPWAAVSWYNADAIAALRRRLLTAVRPQEQRVTLFVPYAASHVLAQVYRTCRVTQTDAVGEGMTLHVEGPPAALRHLQAELKEATR